MRGTEPQAKKTAAAFFSVFPADLFCFRKNPLFHAIKRFFLHQKRFDSFRLPVFDSRVNNHNRAQTREKTEKTI